MTVICTLRAGSELGEGVFGIFAAVFWFMSVAFSWRRPKLGQYLQNENARLNNLCNAIAALCAGIAALLQVIVFYAPSCRDFG